MIIVVKHVKAGNFSYVSHLDTMDVLHRTLKRAKIDVNYSQGFVKHMLTYATTPIPLGTQSVAEYYAVDCNNIKPEEFLQRFNDNVPQDLRAVYAISKPKNPNLAGNVTASDYLIKCKNIVPVEMEDILEEKEYVIDLTKKGEIIQKDVRGMLFSIFVDGRNIWVRSASGNTNLRIDSFVKHLIKEYNIETTMNDITRLAQVVQLDGKFVGVDDYLKL